MKTEQELQARVREIVKTELKRRLDEAHARLPHLCVHNLRHAVDTRKTVLGEPNERYNRIGDARHLPLSQTMGLCMLGAENPEEWNGNICDEPIDAQRCPYFTPREDDQKVATEFWACMKDSVWVEQNLPAVAALLWVAGDPAKPAEEREDPKSPEPEPVKVEEAPAPLALSQRAPWWRRLLNWLWRSDANLGS